MPKRSKAADAPPDAPGEDPVEKFERNMAELERIVARMEQGDLKLEESLKLFERGTQLARDCRGSLDAAELKVRSLAELPEAGPSDEQDDT